MFVIDSEYIAMRRRPVGTCCRGTPLHGDGKPWVVIRGALKWMLKRGLTVTQSVSEPNSEVPMDMIQRPGGGLPWAFSLRKGAHLR